MKRMMFVFAAALMMVACSNEEVAVNDDVQYVSELKLNFGGSRVTAAHNPASGLKFNWENGDEIYVIKNMENNSSIGIYLYDDNTGSFTLKDGNAMEVGEEYFAVMKPSDTCNESNTGTADVQVELNWDNNSTMKKPALISDVFEAKTDGTIATMHHLMGMVEIPVKLHATATYTDITSFDILGGGVSTKIIGNFIAIPKSPYFKEIKSGSPVAYLNDGKTYTLNKETTTSIFIPVLPGTYNDARLNYYYVKDGKSTSKQVILGNITVVRGKITKAIDKSIYSN